jgi:phage terminase Nu1 subunit (DNA packaging protein)
MGGAHKTATAKAKTPRAKARAAGASLSRPMAASTYARHRGVSPEAVRKAVESGRLERSIVIVRGKPKIIDVDLADREWEANTRAARPPTTKRMVLEAEDLDDDAPDPDVTYAEARRRREVELWRQAKIKRQADELDLGTKRGELIPIAEARAAVFDSYTIVRTRLLGVPTRCKQRIAKLTIADVASIDELIREALEELADESADGG